MIYSNNKKIICKSVHIEFVNINQTRFIDEKDIKSMISRYYGDITKMPLNTINISMLENTIKKHPSVKKVEVYKKINGILYIEVEQRIPIVRIINDSNENFYIDKEGVLMPISGNNTARVIVANGNIKENFSEKTSNVFNDTLDLKVLKDIYLISKFIHDDRFLSAQTTQIYVNTSGEYELVPRVGWHIVLLGDIERYKKKLEYLKYFYINVLNKQGWNKYNILNLKFEEQIICEKK